MEKKKKILFIINPTSGIGRQIIVERILRKRLDKSRFDYEITHTEYARQGVTLAKEASEKGCDVVVSVGGDGSANEIAQALVNTNTAMGIIPVGSGNGLAHFLKIPSRISGAVKVLNRLKVKKIDTARLNDKLFISIAGIGFDAVVAEKFDNSKLRGFFSYSKIMFREFMLYKSREYTLEFDGKQIKRRALMISFANSDQYGYYARVAPKASINDGLIDLCIVHRMTIAMAFLVGPRLFFKNVDKSKYVEIHKVKEVAIKCESPVPCHIDGDGEGKITEVKVKVLPLSLNIIVP